MKHYKEVTETNTYRTVAKRTCDLCGCEGKDAGWKTGSYNIGETEIKVTIHQKEGFSSPYGGSGKEYDIDLCPNCFKGKLVPWLISQGANIKQEDWDW